MLEKMMAFAEKGNGRRLLNTLKKKELDLSPSDLETVMKTYCEAGLPREVEMLTNRRGILGEAQYEAMAEDVRRSACAGNLDGFLAALKNLLSSGMKMNPAKMTEDSKTTQEQ